jgi:hypothetical protein
MRPGDWLAAQLHPRWAAGGGDNSGNGNGGGGGAEQGGSSIDAAMVDAFALAVVNGNGNGNGGAADLAALLAQEQEQARARGGLAEAPARQLSHAGKRAGGLIQPEAVLKGAAKENYEAKLAERLGVDRY